MSIVIPSGYNNAVPQHKENTEVLDAR